MHNHPRYTPQPCGEKATGWQSPYRSPLEALVGMLMVLAHFERLAVTLAEDQKLLWFTKRRRAQNDQDYEMEPTMQVRRLTPLECERLMGWPDNHTATSTNGPVSDTNRYKMCGNGIASPVAQWIGEAIMRCRPDAEPRSFMDHYLDQLEAERRSDAE